MGSTISLKTLIFSLAGTILLSCSNHHPDKMTQTESDHIVREVKAASDKMISFSEKALVDSFLSCYDDAPNFLAISGDGVARNYSDFKKINLEYYGSLKEQKLTTLQEKFNVVDQHLVILGWTGNIMATFKNGDTMKMTNYSVTMVFKKIDDQWKVIHSHESSLPPEIIKKG